MLIKKKNEKGKYLFKFLKVSIDQCLQRYMIYINMEKKVIKIAN